MLINVDTEKAMNTKDNVLSLGKIKLWVMICHGKRWFWENLFFLSPKYKRLRIKNTFEHCYNMKGYAGSRDYVGTPHPPQKTPRRAAPHIQLILSLRVLCGTAGCKLF